MKLVRVVFAALALPAVLACGYVLLRNFLFFAGSSGVEYVPFWLGAFCYIAFQAAFYKPLRLYVFGHELTHAFAGILSGAKIKKFKVGKNSGSVVLNKDNVWITLAPYFFPLYTFAAITIYLTLGWFVNIKPLYPYFLFLVGFTVAFHIALTVYIIGIGQSDLKTYGVFFSYVLIIFVNIVVFSLLMVMAFPKEASANAIFSGLLDASVNAYKFIFSGVHLIWQAFQKTN
ncbi:MAG: hypothetical protein LBO62_06505 [Endomicrobium sp.]|jgi:hypothetical protein|nr:hypothetical protein [Endomicrobium sp.]